MTRSKLRVLCWLWVAALGALSPPLRAQVPANSVAVKTYTGYYNDTAVYFAAFETNDVSFAVANNVVYAPHLSQVNGAVLPQMIFIMNGTARQTVVLQTQPGQPDYNPLWQVVTAQWVSANPMPLITSFASANQWAQQGMLVMQPTGVVLNGPVFRINRSLSLLDIGTLAPTISPDEFLGMDPNIRTAYFKMHPGYYNDQLVTFLALEHAPGQISHAPGAIPVPTLNVDRLGAAAFARFYAVDGQPPVIDSIPISIQQVTAGAANGSPVYGGTNGAGGTSAALYSPVWYVLAVTFNPGVTPQPLRSVQAIQQAAGAGLVTVTNGRPDDTFNCPVPFYYQAGATGATPTVTPVYTPPTGTGSTTGTTGTTPPTGGTGGSTTGTTGTTPPTGGTGGSTTGISY